MKQRGLLLILCFSLVTALVAQPQQKNSGEIYESLKGLNVLGSVLYVAAHPDDENTRVITFLSKHHKLNTAYLSLTRGDGGQNLIGPEIGNLLGLIRTQELLAARRIDGGEQFFSRAIDFGYSKTADETLKVWGKEEMLADVIWVIRKFQPDVIITRFPPDERAGHGHHQASAILAEEAFDLAADPKIFPEQLKYVQTWQVKRLFTNTGRWWNTSIDENTPGIGFMDVGTFNAVLGESYTEMASRSRSQHSSQGFGSALRRGYAPEFFEFVKGEHSSQNILEGVDTSWKRVKGGEKIQNLVQKAIQQFDFTNPAKSVETLFEIRTAILALDDGIWKSRKLAETEALIIDCLGLYAEANASHYFTAHGDPLTINFEFTHRSNKPIKLLSIQGYATDTTLNATLESNQSLNIRKRMLIHADAGLSGPYWLNQPHQVGLFKVDDQQLIGKPENEPMLSFAATLDIGGKPITLTLPLTYKWTDPAKGELYRPFEILPPAVLNLSEPAYVFTDDNPKDVQVMVRSNKREALELEVKLELPEGWKSEPARFILNFSKIEEEQKVSFKVYPAKAQGISQMAVKGYSKNGAALKTSDRSLITINYDHIPIQTLLPSAAAKIVKIDLKRGAENIGYIAGAGDGIPAALRNMGYQVKEFKNEEINLSSLKEMDAVVLGIRSLNTNPRIEYFMPAVLEYVKQGGTVIFQYNTSVALETGTVVPYPLKISRDRVAEEDAPVKILLPDHPAMTTPNKITLQDFDGWVQERGLYFPNEWSAEYKALIGTNDTNETEKQGSLLIAAYGQGYFVYTGLSFFRQLPEGVPGAYRLFSNLVSLSASAKVSNAQSSKKTKRK
ncbi:MAG TPA: PIG-L family deacetylase [Cyclobacteriaceae bacterium]|nr:PIG-L family deacetylase [Cyclobacteriaceae bacterium]